MTITRGKLLVCIMAGVCMAGNALAQQSPAPAAPAAAAQADAAAALRGKDVLSEQDKAQLNQWIVERANSLLEAAKKNDLKTMATIRRNMIDAATGSVPATPAFRIAYVELCSAVFPPYLGVGDDPKGSDARVALYLVQALGSVRQIGSLDAMLGALGSKYPAVRLYAAKTVRDLHSEIVASRANQIGRIITTLQQAGAKEGDASIAKVLYEAVDFRAASPGTAGQVGAAIVEMLKGRQTFYANDLVSEFYPDACAMNTLQSIELPDAEKSKVIPILCGIIDMVSQRWEPLARLEAGQPIDRENPYDELSVRDWRLRYQLTYVAMEAEALLKKLGAVPAGSQAPDMASLMGSLATADQVIAAAEKWQDLVLPKAPTTAPAAADTTAP